MGPFNLDITLVFSGNCSWVLKGADSSWEEVNSSVMPFPRPSFETCVYPIITTITLLCSNKLFLILLFFVFHVSTYLNVFCTNKKLWDTWQELHCCENICISNLLLSPKSCLVYVYNHVMSYFEYLIFKHNCTNDAHCTITSHNFQYFLNDHIKTKSLKGPPNSTHNVVVVVNKF